MTDDNSAAGRLLNRGMKTPPDAPHGRLEASSTDMSTNVDSLPATDTSSAHSAASSILPQRNMSEPITATTKVNTTGTSKNKDMSGFSATGLLIRLRWRMIRSRFFKIGLVFAFLLFFPVAYSVINMGYLVEIAATQTGESAASIYAQAWLTSLDAGNIAPLGALAIGGAVAVAFFAPFTGTSTLSLVSSDDLLSVRPNRKHRFWDSLLINASSGIGLLQLVTLTAVTSLITLDGERIWALLFTWALWFFLVSVNTTLGFSLEWLHRKWGPRKRKIMAMAGLAILAVAILLDDKKGSDLFGSAKYYTKTLRLSVENFNPWSVWIILFLIALNVLLITYGLKTTESAFSLPERSTVRGGVHKKGRMGSNAFLVAAALMWKTLFRTKECRRPIIAIFIVGTPVAMFTKFDQTITIAFIMTVPLAISLGWGVNVFGVVGQGMSWLGSQPKVMWMIPHVTALFQFSASVLLIGWFWFVGYVTGHATLKDAQLLLIGAVVAATGTTALSLLLSVTKPIRSSLKGRGDALIPPMTALVYLVILVMFGCLPGVLIAQDAIPGKQGTIFVGSLIVSVGVLLFGWALWDNPKMKAKVVAKVSVE